MINYQENKLLPYSLLLILFLAISGCLSKPYYYLKPEAIEQLQTLDVIIFMQEPALEIATEKSYLSQGAGGGIIFAVLDGIIEEKQRQRKESYIKPIRNGLQNYNFDQVLKSNLTTALQHHDWLNVHSISIEKQTNKKAIENRLKTSDTSALLAIIPRFIFNPRTQRIDTYVSVYIFPKDPALMVYQQKPDTDKETLQQSDAIYRSKTIINKKLSSIDYSPEDVEYEKGKQRIMLENITIWAKNDSAIIRKKMDSIAQEIAQWIQFDLSLRPKK